MTTAVERFAARHEGGRLASNGVYQSRLPAAPPGPGQQYAFEVDLDACTGCKACVTACHSVNGLDDGESWRRVGLLVGTDTPYQQTVTTGCHHCADPACMSGCPVDAYEKDPVTGIVHHLDDQCIGCRYCTLTCPYEVPRFNARLGIVRKCDLCAPRLAVGEEPACVQGCPTSAIKVAIVDIAGLQRSGAWAIPESPSPARTTPSTVYRSRRPIPADALPADHFEVSPAQNHMPLAVMLVLSQLAVATYLVESGRAAVAALAASLAMLASLTHLGRPLQAWRAVIGLRHSWVSREILAISAFTGLAAVQAVVALAGHEVPGALPVVTAGFGLAGIACSVAIYAATGRAWWSAPRLVVGFGLSMLGFALAVAAATHPWAALAVPGVTAAKLASLAMVVRHRREPLSELGRTAVLLTGALRPDVERRVLLAAVGGVCCPVAAFVTGVGLLSLVGLVVSVAGEVLDRSLFFTASAAPRMPGSRR